MTEAAEATEGTLPVPTGFGRLIDLRFSWRDGALVVRSSALGYVIAVAGVGIGAGIAANGVWGRSGDAGQVVFGTVYALIGAWFGFVTSRPWVSADAAGLRVGPLRAARVPWDQVTGITMADASAWSPRWASLRIERRGARTLHLVPVLMTKTPHQLAELRYVAKRLALEGQRHGAGPIRWPEHLTYRDRSGDTHKVV